MMVLDLRLFDIVEGFNVLFKFVPNLFQNPNSFGNPDFFENLEIFKYSSRSRKNFVFPTRLDTFGSRTLLVYVYFVYILYIYVYTYLVYILYIYIYTYLVYILYIYVYTNLVYIFITPWTHTPYYLFFFISFIFCFS